MRESCRFHRHLRREVIRVELIYHLAPWRLRRRGEPHVVDPLDRLMIEFVEVRRPLGFVARHVTGEPAAVLVVWDLGDAARDRIWMIVTRFRLLEA